jgi:hypothetical protein
VKPPVAAQTLSPAALKMAAWSILPVPMRLCHLCVSNPVPLTMFHLSIHSAWSLKVMVGGISSGCCVGRGGCLYTFDRRNLCGVSSSVSRSVFHFSSLSFLPIFVCPSEKRKYLART